MTDLVVDFNRRDALNQIIARIPSDASIQRDDVVRLIDDDFDFWVSGLVTQILPDDERLLIQVDWTTKQRVPDEPVVEQAVRTFIHSNLLLKQAASTADTFQWIRGALVVHDDDDSPNSSGDASLEQLLSKAG